jgi:hypothetical protein
MPWYLEPIPKGIIELEKYHSEPMAEGCMRIGKWLKRLLQRMNRKSAICGLLAATIVSFG